MSDLDVFLQQLLTGLVNGAIIALIALGYTMVYGIVELINFAHGDLFMLGAFFALSLLGIIGIPPEGYLFANIGMILLLIVSSGVFCGALNMAINALAYRPVRSSPRLVPLVSAIGVSFILLNLGLFWGGLPLAIFGNGLAAAAPKDFPSLLPVVNLFGDEAAIFFAPRDLLVLLVTLPLLGALVYLVQYTKLGLAMRAVAQDKEAASLLGVEVEDVIAKTFFIGGFLAGGASVVYAVFNNTIFFQMGYRIGLDAFTAAVLGGIGNLTGACLGGMLIGVLRSCTDQYLSTEWTNVVVFAVLIAVLVIRPRGLLGSTVKEKV